MKDLIVNYKLSRKLKNIGYDVPTAHSYIHLEGEEYRLHLFTYLLGTDGYLGKILQKEKKTVAFDILFIEDEHEVYFNYNQDFNKLLVKLINGEECMNDEKCLNMSTDSYTYSTWDYETKEAKKQLPNYNNGDFEFDVYQDIISAPRKDEVLKWFRDGYNLYGFVQEYYDNYSSQFLGYDWWITKNNKTLLQPSICLDSYQEAENELIEELIKIVENETNI